MSGDYEHVVSRSCLYASNLDQSVSSDGMQIGLYSHALLVHVS